MIQHIKIENYKSIPSLELDLGRVNVFIGENGSGKTNILEAVALGSAAAERKVDSEFLSNRGIRLTDTELMHSAFNTESSEKIKIDFINKFKEDVKFEILAKGSNTLQSRGRSFGSTIPVKIKISELEDIEREILEKIFSIGIYKDEIEGYFVFNNNSDFLSELVESISENETLKEKFDINELVFFNLIGFLNFSPENHFLRRFEEEAQIRPLGIRGEGLFSHLADLARKEPQIFQKINETLQLIDWFGEFEMPNDLIFNERRIRIRDRYLEEGIQYIDQRSSNEGFLYLLFYVTLFISPHTPKFFAIDNIDNALNPKLCSKLIEVLVQLAKENDKQVIVTAHNPGLLDGLNLNDKEQRLFVISRNKLGHTKSLRIEQKPSTNGHEPVRLSEQFLRGYIGGLPKNF